MSNEIVLNKGFNGFMLSDEALLELKNLGVIVKNPYTYDNRTCSKLISVVKKLGKRAGQSLEIETFEGNLYYIDEYDGMETVVTPNDIEWKKVEQKEEGNDNV